MALSLYHNEDIFAIVMTIFRLQHFRKLFNHIVYGDIKTRYNVFRKYANDVLILPTSYASALCLMLDAWCYAPYCAMRNARGAIFLGLLASELADSLFVDYLAQATTHRF